MLVERMEQSLVVEEAPEMLLRKLFEVGDRLDEDIFLSLVLERSSQMVMVDHVGPAFRPDYNRDHMLPEIFSLAVAQFVPPLSARFNLDQTDRDLGWPERMDRHGREDRIATVGHC